MGRALVIRLARADDAYRLLVPELGDRRFADSAIALKAGDSMSVALMGRRGKLGEARLRVIDADAGTGSCVTWPSAEIDAATYKRAAARGAWRVAAERDSVMPVAVDSLAAMNAADSAALVTAVTSLLSSLPQPADSRLHGIPFGIRRAYSFRVAGIPAIAAEVARTSSTEADPREERLFIIGERARADAQTYRLAYSRRVSGGADSTGVADLLAVLLVKQPGRALVVLGLEDQSGLRVQLLERARGRWKPTWSSVTALC